MTTVGEQLVEWLEAYGVDTVFGIPGVHTVEMYRGLATSKIKHLTPRHEQGAGFMADGYYRASGRVAAAFVITGPGLTNILTPMAQAFGDSIPMLVVSSVNRSKSRGMGAGDLHEVANQSLIGAQAAAFSHTLTDPSQLGPVLARAFAVFEGARPRPVHIEIPVDMFSMEAVGTVTRPAQILRPMPNPNALTKAAEALAKAKAPLVLAGGGAVGAKIQLLAERLGAPVVMTTNGRGILPVDHPLAVPASPSLKSVRKLIGSADVVLAVGTEVGRTDYDMYDREDIAVNGLIIRLEIEAEQMRRGAIPDIALLGDAATGIDGLCAMLELQPPEAPKEADGARKASLAEIGESYRKIVTFLNKIRNALPGVPIVCDSTQAAYAGNLFFAADAPRTWFNASTGYGALGYGLPAAIGASQAIQSPVVCVAGDGGVQFTLAELGLAIEEKLPLILIVWDNKGYGEIKSYMVENRITPVGVDLHTPDFVGLGIAYGAHAERVEMLHELPDMLIDAADRKGPTVLHLPEEVVLGTR